MGNVKSLDFTESDIKDEIIEEFIRVSAELIEISSPITLHFSKFEESKDDWINPPFT